jgi:HSP20 family protein
MTTLRTTQQGDPFGGLFENFMGPLAPFSRGASMARSFDADVVEREGDIRVMVEMPGLTPDDISVDLEANVLTISGEKRESRQEGDERDTWHLNERRYGRFSRSFVLPRGVDSDRVQARFENGVLTVTVPKSEQARRRRIEISGGSERRQVEAESPGD